MLPTINHPKDTTRFNTVIKPIDFFNWTWVITYLRLRDCKDSADQKHLSE